MVYLTFGTDIKRYLTFLNYNFSSQDKYLGVITIKYHVIEKGLTMPQTRLGFGKTHILDLCNLINEYHDKGYDVNQFEIRYASLVLNEYKKFHQDQQYELEPEILTVINKTVVLTNYPQSSTQLNFTSDSFFQSVNDQFPAFAQSRHTIRNYSPEKIPIEELVDAVRIAQNAPSSCNRQPVRAYIVTKDSAIKTILNLQGGNGGFGHLATSLFVITSNISLFQDVLERWQPTLNAGFFGMALLYALHFKKIGCATLNWSEDKRKDKKLRSFLNIPPNEHVHLLICCGYLPDEFRVAASLRNDVKHICKIIA